MLRRMRLFSRLLLPVSMLLLMVLVGAFGFMLIEQYSFINALYMSVITIATVGFGEVEPLSYSGKIFVIGLILVNLALFTYYITLITRFFSDGEFVRTYKLMKMENSIKHLQHHVIICGFGRNGKESAQVLHNNKIPFVVLEEKNELEPGLDFAVTHFMKGDATKDDVLIEAGINKARALITTLPVDADNLFVVLTAKQINPAIKVISRASQDSSVSKLKIAGADNVIMPDKIGGAHMATLVILPDVVEMLSLMSTQSNESFRIAELPSGKTVNLGDLDLWNKTGCTLLGIKSPGLDYSINPGPGHSVKPADRLIVMGSDEQIARARQLIV